MINGPGFMALIGNAFLTWRRFLQAGYGKQGLTLKQNYLLRQLEKKEFLNPSEIADQLFCDRPTATVIIRNLEKQGWIRVHQDPQNGKKRRVILTDSGRQKIGELNQWEDRPEFHFDPISCFTEEEIKTFTSLVRKLNKHLDTIKGKQSS